jgi:hypothetical protein
MKIRCSIALKMIFLIKAIGHWLERIIWSNEIIMDYRGTHYIGKYMLERMPGKGIQWGLI